MANRYLEKLASLKFENPTELFNNTINRLAKKHKSIRVAASGIKIPGAPDLGSGSDDLHENIAKLKAFKDKYPWVAK